MGIFGRIVSAVLRSRSAAPVVPVEYMATARAARRVTGGHSGNARDRRRARRVHLAHRWYLAHLRARVGKAAA